MRHGRGIGRLILGITRHPEVSEAPTIPCTNCKQSPCHAESCRFGIAIRVLGRDRTILPAKCAEMRPLANVRFHTLVDAPLSQFGDLGHALREPNANYKRFSAQFVPVSCRTLRPAPAYRRPLIECGSRAAQFK